MAINPKSLRNLRPNTFKKGQSGNPRGRPKKITTLAKELKYSLDDVRERIKFLMFKNHIELDAIRRNDKTLMLDKIIANALIKDLSKGQISTLDSLMTRVWGAPKQTVETTGTNGGPIQFESVKKTIDKEHMAGVFETAARVLRDNE